MKMEEVRREKMEKSEIFSKVNKEQEFAHLVNQNEFSGC